MALVRRGTRTLTIDGIVYRWTVRPTGTYLQSTSAAGMTVAVERADSPACTLHLTLPAARPDHWLSRRGYVVWPRDVAAWVREALARGWAPDRPGGAFRLALSAEHLREDGFVERG